MVSAEPALPGGFEAIRVMPVAPPVPVLVVDDSTTTINILRRSLRQLGFNDVDAAPNGAAALAQMRGRRYGLVIADWNMTPMTGYDLLTEVRDDPLLKRTPFIMITAEFKTDYVIAAKRAGVDNYIVKPFTAQTLKTKIDMAFAAKAASGLG